MFSIPLNTVYFVITPMITGQFLLLILFYFTFMRRDSIVDFPLHACFIICFILFLLGTPLQAYGDRNTAYTILYARFVILFSIGIPSMLIANIRYCNITMNRLLYIIPYLIGLIGSILYVVIRDGSSFQIFFSQKYGYILPTMISDASYRDVLIIVTSLLLVFPSSYLIYRQLKKGKELTSLLFLSSSLILGILFIVGEISNYFSLIYIGSFITASLWCWAAYTDINAMKVQANTLKDELEALINSDEQNIQPELIKLLDNLAINAKDNIEDYKLSIKEILRLLTSTTIKQGGDSSVLTQRNIDNINAIQLSNNTQDIRSLATNEVLELSNILADHPTKGNKELVDKAIQYIKTHYYKELELAEIVNFTEVSDSYLIRTFKKVTGKTLNQYITSYRIQQAKYFLKDNTVKETANAVGFKNSSYFSNVFKKTTGLSPLQFQKININNK